jgi:hypothetical protein
VWATIADFHDMRWLPTIAKTTGNELDPALMLNPLRTPPGPAIHRRLISIAPLLRPDNILNGGKEPRMLQVCASSFSGDCSLS